MNIKELVASIEVELEAVEKRELKAKREIEVILDTARQEGRTELSESEATRTDELFSAIDLAKAQVIGVKDKLARARKVEAEEAEMEARANERPTETPAAGKSRRTAELSVGREERTYHKGNDPTGARFLRDVVAAQIMREPAANDRLNQHMHEERIERGQKLERVAGDFVTGTGGVGLVIPQYLVDMTAPAVANGRPFADACNKHTLPSQGMTVEIPRVTTPTKAELQTTELTPTNAQSAVTDDLSAAVKTAEGWEKVSIQAIQRGTGIGDILLQDLFRQLNTTLDNELVNGSSTGLNAVANEETYTSASPTGEELYEALVGTSMAGVEAALLNMGQPDIMVMHSSRWYWLQAQLTSKWPIVGQQFGGMGSKTGAGYGAGIRGQLPNGAGVVVDNNVATNLGTGTNEDRVYVMAANEAHLWEDPSQPAFIRAEQPAATGLAVYLVVYSFFAYTFERYANAVQTLGGTGMILA